ncbi:sensor histidine kinase [Dethiothermospora halolimnae]|uniref:sensor histidine kinase n=1 Tax=Dethiothermospora halolimnae TaxID=3114390 RepID=UPI003CCB9782
MNKKLWFIIGLGQTLIIFLLLFLLLTKRYKHFNRWFLIGILSIALIIIINISVLIKFIKSLIREKELEVVKTDLKNTEAMINLLRQKGHDHINHIQTVSSMLILEEYDVAKNYLQGISNSYRFSGHFLRLGNPTLTALVNTKKELANEKEIEFVIEKYCRVKLSSIKPWDISSIVGNLLDNSIEYVLTNDIPKKMFFHVEHTENLDGYIFKIGNPYIDEDINTEDFFKQGFSTKENTGRGYGLYIVKELVEKYSGSIDVDKCNNRIDFIVKIGD